MHLLCLIAFAAVAATQWRHLVFIQFCPVHGTQTNGNTSRANRLGWRNRWRTRTRSIAASERASRSVSHLLELPPCADLSIFDVTQRPRHAREIAGETGFKTDATLWHLYVCVCVCARNICLFDPARTMRACAYNCIVECVCVCLWKFANAARWRVLLFRNHVGLMALLRNIFIIVRLRSCERLYSIYIIVIIYPLVKTRLYSVFLDNKR